MAKKILDLTGKWQFKEYPATARRMRDLEDNDWLNCTIPNSIFTNLIEAGKIDPFDIDANPENYTWVSDKPWVFRKAFDASEEILKADKIELVCDGLDTIASIWLNERLLGKTENMFIGHRFDVTKYLKPTSNFLIIKFDPVVPYAKKLMERYTPFSEKQFHNPYRAYVRKAQYQFGWDFCPPLPGCGIWKSLKIEANTNARLKNVNIKTIHCDEKHADIRFAVTLDRINRRQKFHCTLDIYDNQTTVARQLKFELHGDSGSAVVHIDNPNLWFPAGYGSPYLYQARVNLFAQDELVDTIQCPFGIRIVKLNQAADKSGKKFQLEINDRKIYAKGANWIPASIFAGSVKNKDYDKIITAAAKANINIIRVWGGGYYEHDYFYDLCDKLGIMVWQDFMFACCYYPDRQWFLDKIADEAQCVIERLYNHPSIVLFCGNNEIDWLHYKAAGGSGKRLHGKTIWHKLLPKILNDLDPDRSYITSTPFSATEDPNDHNSGTVHSWHVWSGHQPINAYITTPELVPRFVTEFGFQSPPHLDTLKKCCPSEHLRLAAAEVEKHNYQMQGYSRLYRYLGDIFGRACNLEQFIYLGQLVQARAVKTCVEFLRANSKRNDGVLFWQLNDCCNAISWSALDYNKKPKALYYYARRFFAPILLSVVPEFNTNASAQTERPDSLSIVAVNQTDSPLTGKILANLIDLYGKSIDKVDLPLAVGPFNTSQLIHLPRALARPDNPQNNFLYVQLQTHDVAVAENLYLYLPDKYIDWPRPNITRKIANIGQNKALLTLCSDTIVKDLRIDIPDNVGLSDNFLDLLPQTQVQIEMNFDNHLEKYDKQIEFTSVADALAE